MLGLPISAGLIERFAVNRAFADPGLAVRTHAALVRVRLGDRLVGHISRDGTDDFGGRHIRVKGNAKVMSHLMFGVLALTADQLHRLLT